MLVKKDRLNFGNFRHKIKRLIDILESLQSKDTYKYLQKCDILFICHDLDRGDTVNGKAYSKLLDNVYDELNSKGFKTQSLAHAYSKLFGEKTWSNAHSANRVLFVAAIKKRLMKFLKKFYIVHTIKDCQADAYITILKIASPSSIITIGSPPALCRAAHALDIKICELLHGIGYTPIPWGWDKAPTVELPDIIWSLDETSTKTFSALRAKGITLRQIPHPLYSRLNKGNINRAPLIPVEFTSLPQSIPRNKKLFLFSLQWGYDGDHIKNSHFDGILKNGLIPEPIIDAISEMGDDYFWLFRLHPEQLRSNRYNYHKIYLSKIVEKHKNCEWNLTSQLPLPLVLNHCSGHITMTSMTSYDAAFMSVKSLLLCPTLKKGGVNQNMFEDLVKEGFATKSKLNFSDICEWIRNITPAYSPFSISNTDDWNECVLELTSTNK